MLVEARLAVEPAPPLKVLKPWCGLVPRAGVFSMRARLMVAFPSRQGRWARGEQLHHASLERRRHHHLRGRRADAVVLFRGRSHRRPGQAHEPGYRGNLTHRRSRHGRCGTALSLKLESRGNCDHVLPGSRCTRNVGVGTFMRNVKRIGPSCHHPVAIAGARI